MLDCLKRGEAPFASHLLYPQCLDDNCTEDRQLGIIAGFEWGKLVQKRIFYIDFGISKGMHAGEQEAQQLNQVQEYRKLPQSLMHKLHNIEHNITKGFKE